ncbi:MAG: GNAT family N-acetyltransferase [Mucilaginibacter sp.]|uniref:GNAT family N-acetyltransferase n=1 Tax=Mucilaginibacter sp. TaxID=1882438 RepID=UPI0032639471
MKIEREEKNHRGAFYVEQDKHWLAEMAYGITSDKMIIYHTEVSDALKGQHVGQELVKAGVEYARGHSFKIVPLCPFAKAIIDKTEAFQDVLDPEYLTK